MTGPGPAGFPDQPLPGAPAYAQRPGWPDCLLTRSGNFGHCLGELGLVQPCVRAAGRQ